MRIADLFAQSARLNPDRVALRDPQSAYSFSEAVAFVERVSGGLRAVCGRGSHIGIYSPNDCRVTLLQLGINAADMAWIAMHPGNAPSANAAILREFACDLLFYHPHFAEHIDSVREALPNLPMVALDDAGRGDPVFDQWAAAPCKLGSGNPGHPDDRALLQPTGGTTGLPKGVVHTNRTLEACLLAFKHEDPVLEHCVMLALAPLTHAAGIRALSALLAGGTVVILPAFDIDAVIDAIEQHRITSTFMPPTALYALLDHPRTAEADLSSLNNLTLGASPMSLGRFKQAIERLGPILYESYGQTEALAPLTFKVPADYLRDDGSIDEAAAASIGKPAYNVWIEIVDDEGRPLPDGETGEIVVRSNMVMHEYFRNPEATAFASRGGWHHTDDVGFRDARGLITLVDRKKDMIISGGFNIYPAQLENLLNGHAAIAGSIVIGVPDDHWGEAVVAVIQLKVGAELTAEEVQALCRAELGRIYAPKRVEFWPSLPRSPVGKLLRREVKEHFWNDTQRKI